MSRKLAGVGTKLLFENGEMAVWEMVLPPGGCSGYHRHERDYVLWIMEGSERVRVVDEQGRQVGAEVPLLSGECHQWRVDGQELERVSDGLRLPIAHEAINMSATDTFREILVERKH